MKAITTLVKSDSIGAKHPAIIYDALQANNQYIRNNALKYIDIKKSWDRDRLKNIFRVMASSDMYAPNRAKAIDFLGQMQDKESINVFKKGILEESFSVVANALLALKNTDTAQAYKYAVELAPTAKGEVKTAIGSIFSTSKNVANNNYFLQAIPTSFGNERISLLQFYCDYLYTMQTKNIYEDVFKILFNYATNDERESIKIASAKKLNQILTDINTKILMIDNKQNIDFKTALETALQMLYKNEKNSKVIAEYKRMGWIK
jgi:HEAT repeat protein